MQGTTPEQPRTGPRAPRISGVTLPRHPTHPAVPPPAPLTVSLYRGEYQHADHVSLDAALRTLADLVRIRAGQGETDIGGLAIRVHTNTR